jgi:hypothetical protein
MDIDAQPAKGDDLTSSLRLSMVRDVPVEEVPQFRRKRVKTGCMTCRRRKKKCNEAKPACAGCRRNGLSCEWPTFIERVECKSSSVIQAFEGSKILHSERSVSRSTPQSGRTARFPSHRFSFPVFGSSAASALTNESSLFLRHYANETGDILAVQKIDRNPFLTHILPLASSDELLMHSVLAVGGIHLASRLPTSHEVSRSALTHYIAMVEGVRTEVSNLKGKDYSSVIRLFVVLIMLCHYQVC